MMTRITITIETEVEGGTEELKDALSSIIKLSTTTSLQPPVFQHQLDGARIPDDHWTPARIENLWNRIKPNARRVLFACASKPEGITADELYETLNIKPRALGGMVSSIGHAINYYRKHVDPELDARGPFVGDGTYRLKASFIPVILGLHERNQ
jgi:hypothetical protein